MTEREPDHLYEELRRKLEDYGSHPSPDLWAGLEQHLAAQPAAPARRQRRTWLLAAACLLLLLTASVLWLRFVPTSPTGTLATGPAAEPAATSREARTQVGATETAPAAGSTRPRPATETASSEATAATARPETSSPGPAARPRPTVAAADHAVAAVDHSSVAGAARGPRKQPGAARATAATPETAAGSSASLAGPGRESEAAHSGRRGRQHPAARPGGGAVQSGVAAAESAGARSPRSGRWPVAATPEGQPTTETDGSVAARPAAPTTTAAASAGVTESVQPQAKNPAAQLEASPGATTGPATVAGIQQPTTSKLSPAETTTAPTEPAASSTAAASAARPTGAQSRTVSAPSTPAADALPTLASAATARPAAGADGTTSTPPAPTIDARPTLAPELLPGRWALLQLPLAALPTPLTGVSLASQPPAPTLPGRWSVAVLAGPAVTYRLLGTAFDSAGPGLSRLERPALSYAAQVQLGYAASARLRLSSGLGYQEFATGYNATINAAKVQTVTTQRVQVFYNGTRRDSIIFAFTRDTIVGTEQKRLRQRDTYRYLVLPLQAQWRLGGTGRWSYYGLAGATLGLYLGGRSTEGGSACNCEQVSWSAGRSPFRRTTALLTLGAAAEYELRPGWHLLLQPVVQQAVLSITDETRAARRPLGASVQTGLRVDLP